MLAPRHPCHRSGTLSGGCGCGQALRRHVGEQQLLERDLVDRPRRVDDRAVGRDEQRELPAAVALADDLAHAADRPERPPRPHQDAVGVEQRLDVALEAHAAAGEQDDVVADALDVGDHVRCDHDGGGGLGDAVHQQLQELAAGEGVEPRERLVEQQSGGRLPRASASASRARSPADRSQTFVRRAERRQQLGGDRASQRGFVERANSIVSRDGERAVERRALGDEPDVREHAGSRAGRARAPDRALGRCQQRRRRARAASTCRRRSRRPGRRSRSGTARACSRGARHSRRKRLPSPRASSGETVMRRDARASCGASPR